MHRLLAASILILGISPPLSLADPAPKDQPVIRAIQCMDNLHQIYDGIALYSNEHTGKYPPDLGTLMVDQKMEMTTFICPAAGGALPKDWQKLDPKAQAKWVNDHTDYIYHGAKWSVGELHSDEPLVYEKDDDHGGVSINVLFGDGHVNFIKLAALRNAFGEKAGTERTTQRVKAEPGQPPAIPLVTLDQAKALLAKADIHALKQAVMAFEIDNGRYPTAEEGLDAVVHKPKASDMTNWRQEAEKLPVDPWGHGYRYRIPGDNNADFAIYSCGPDGKPGTDDDVK